METLARRAGPLALGAMVVLGQGCATSDDDPTRGGDPVGTAVAAVVAADGGTTTPAIGSFAIYATEAVEMSSGSSVAGCNVGVENAGGPYLGDGASADLKSGAKIALSQTLYAPSVNLSGGASLGAINAVSVADSKGATHGAVSSFPSMPAPPVTPAAASGGAAVRLNAGTSKTLGSGAYGAVTVSSGAALTLSGGTYVFASLSLSSGSTLAVTSATSLSVTGPASFGSGSFMGPPSGSDLTAKALSVYFDSSSAVTVSSGATVRALFVATGALVTISTSKFTGAVAAAQVALSSGATVTCEDSLDDLGDCTASCDDGNACTSDSCSGGSCVHTPVADGAACSDGTACTQSDACSAGLCVGSNPVICASQDSCHLAGTCDPATGSCSNPAAPDGTSCAITNAAGACETGACTLTSCNAGFADCNGDLSDGCETPTTTTANCGACGVACGTGPDATGAVCTNGACISPCAAPDACHVGGTRDPASGLCSNPPVPDGSPCGSPNACGRTDACQAGSCISDACTPCATSADCQDPRAPICSGGGCQCLTSSDCPASAPTCVDHSCAPCSSDADCRAPSPHCVTNPSTGPVGSCVQCTDNLQCPELQPVCSSGVRNVCGTCVSDSDCAGRGPNRICDLVMPPWVGACIGCFSDSDCEPGEHCDGTPSAPSACLPD